MILSVEMRKDVIKYIFFPDCEKTCGENKGCNGGNTGGTGGRMTLRSSPDGVLEMGGTRGFGGAGDPSGVTGGNVPPPDSPDSKYWCFAAAAASAEHKHTVRLSVDFPDYHYADRNYLHKHGLPVIGKFTDFAPNEKCEELCWFDCEM